MTKEISYTSKRGSGAKQFGCTRMTKRMQTPRPIKTVLCTHHFSHGGPKICRGANRRVERQKDLSKVGRWTNICHVSLQHFSYFFLQRKLLSSSLL